MTENLNEVRVFKGNEVLMPEFRLEGGAVDGAECRHLHMQTFERVSEDSDDWRSSPENSWPRIATIHPNHLYLFPIHANPYAQRYQSPRHGVIRTVLYVDTRNEPLPQTANEARDQIHHRLPWGSFTGYGFEREVGLSKELEEVWRVLGRMLKRPTLVVLQKGESHLTPTEIVVNESELDSLRRALNRIDRRKRDGVRDAKQAAIVNELMTKLDPDHFIQASPAGSTLITPGAGRARRAPPLLRNASRASVAAVRASLPLLASESPSSLLELHSEIERVTLSEMIARYEELLAADLPESRWQAFFQTNRLVLSLVFARPVRLLHPQFHAQPSSIDGSGAQIGDFLLRELGQGLAIVEIKKPGTDLMRGRPYRNSQVYAPSDELGGAITQALLQQSALRANWLVHQGNAGLRESKPDVIKCVVVAGTTPADDAKKRSFEVFRNACKDVEVVTFDEMLAKLKLLLRHLTPPHVTEADLPF